LVSFPETIMNQIQRLLRAAIYLLTTLLGAGAFLYPFWFPAVPLGNQEMAHAADAPLLLALLVGVCFLVLLLEVQSQLMSAKLVALLGVLTAANAVLRFVDVAVPGPGGFSPIFVLIILAGYVYGGGFGFLLGALTLLVSGLITGGVGPWLPYQMFAAGWVGLSAPLCRPLVTALGLQGRWGESLLLACLGGLWGLLYGGIMNIWFWPFIAGGPGQYWEPGIGLTATLQRYAAFYLATSFLWDLMRAAGNVLLLVLLAAPILRVLRRFYRRFTFYYQPAPVVPLRQPVRPVQPEWQPGFPRQTSEGNL
jgi:energy-coupling factor transport system substrate-specific component